MTRIGFPALLLALGLIVGASPSPSAATGGTGEESAIDLLPESTLLAVELRDVARRWEEIRGLPAIARFQDRVLQDSGISAAALRELVGDRTVLALIAEDDLRGVVPVALLRPPRLDRAVVLLDELAGGSRNGNPVLSVHRSGSTLWIAPAAAGERVERLARRAGTSPGPGLSVDEVAGRLPAGGIARGWLNPSRVRELLRDRAEATLPPSLELLASLAAAELETVRFAGFRRDLTAAGVATDLVVGYETDALPAEVARALAAPGPASVLPRALPAGVVAIASFRPEAEAALAWLRLAAAGDPRGPLRNLDFWIDEFERRSRLDLESDLVKTLGERGWLIVLAGETADTLQCVAIVETGRPRRLERALVELRDWWSGQAAGRSLGLAIPRGWDADSSEGILHGTAIWTPLGELPGPVFLATDRHLLLGSGTRAVATGLGLLPSIDSWSPVRATEDGAAARESLLADGARLAPVLRMLLRSADAETAGRLGAAVEELAGGLGRISVAVWYETDAVRLRGEIRFVEPAPSAR